MAPLDSLRVALVDRYHLDRQLGQGGMATVYLAHDLKHDRDVALKVLRPELARQPRAGSLVLRLGGITQTATRVP